MNAVGSGAGVTPRADARPSSRGSQPFATDPGATSSTAPPRSPTCASRHLEYYENGRWVDASGRSDIDRIERQQDFIKKLGRIAVRARPSTTRSIAPDLADQPDPQPHRRPVVRPRRRSTSWCGRSWGSPRHRRRARPSRRCRGNGRNAAGSFLVEKQPEADAVLAVLRGEAPDPHHHDRAARPTAAGGAAPRRGAPVRRAGDGAQRLRRAERRRQHRAGAPAEGLRERRRRERPARARRPQRDPLRAVRPGQGPAPARPSCPAPGLVADSSRSGYRHRAGRSARTSRAWAAPATTGAPGADDHDAVARSGLRLDREEQGECRGRRPTRAAASNEGATERPALARLLGPARDRGRHRERVHDQRGGAGRPRHHRPGRRRSSGSPGSTLAPPPPGGANYLIIGSDTRAFVDNASDAAAFGDPDDPDDSVEGQRSDTMMVAHVEPGAQRTFVVSFPRDLMVDVPGIAGKSQINSAYSDAAVRRRSIDTLKANFDIDINHYLEVDFKSFQEIVDDIGNVSVYLPGRIRDQELGLQHPVRRRLLPARRRPALVYVRVPQPARSPIPTARSSTPTPASTGAARRPLRPRPHRAPAVRSSASSPASRSRRAWATRSSRCRWPTTCSDTSRPTRA